ncbi:MAG: GNAT family N-acetyltransferase [Paludibaculum sp.]
MRLTELRAVPASSLVRLLAEEKARWLALLHWDFTPSAELVMRYVSMQALDGFVLVDDGEPVGYVYWVMEDHKGLIGDLYVRDAWRSPANENMLMGAALGQLRRYPWIRRVEAQLMQLAMRGSQVAPVGLRPHIFPGISCSPPRPASKGSAMSIPSLKSASRTGACAGSTPPRS